MKRLIFVEGKWDKLFAQQILAPRFKRRYNIEPNIRTYKELPKTEVTKQVNLFESIGKWTLLADHDEHRNSCILTCRTKLKDEFSLPSIDNVCLAIREIEDWYSWGITEETAERYSIPDWYEGKPLGKDFFKRPGESEIDFRIKILKEFSVKSAMKCESFKYFLQKYDLIFE